MNIVQAEDNLKKITTKFSKESFIFDLMWAYDFPKATISRLQKGTLDKAKNENEVVLKKKFYFISTSKKDLDSIFEKAIKDNSILKHDPRFIIVTDYQSIKAYDTKVGEKLDAEIKTLSKHPDFFLPWAGIEKKVFNVENPADVKAAEKLAKLFDLIRLDNIKFEEKNRHALNVFLTRVLFCFFAEDTDIFPKGLFTESIASHTNNDGSDLDNYLLKLFEVLNKKSRTGLPEYLNEFPYVNGGLFAEEFPIPKFSKRSRESLIDLGSDLNWAEINPDIFGSMIQAVVHPDQRAGLGMHYTSVTNIMKVIEPLFLSELKDEFEKTKSNKPKLKKLLERINNIKIFDPACGSGNFLIIAYKELRLLEIKILKELGSFTVSAIPLSNFYGIEIDDFAHEVAKLSLWLAEHQMDVQFNKEFGNVKASLPLKDSGRIVCGNALTKNWEKICSINTKNEEVYVLGNPPYLGARNQTEEHKIDLEQVFNGHEDYKDADYVLGWFLKASAYINGKNSKFAFVSTNSIVQGEQVGILWPRVFERKLEIDFAHRSFKWANNAKDKAAVICVIVGVRKESQLPKKIFDDGHLQIVSNITPYLHTGETIIVHGSKYPLNKLPKAVMGNMPRDGGNLILSTDAKDELLKKYPSARKLFKKYIGAQEFMDGSERWCLWITDEDRSLAESIPEIKKRINAVYDFRTASKAKTTNGYAAIPHKFAQRSPNKGNSIIIPRTTSERRNYVPFGFFDESTIVSDSAHAIFDVETWIFGLISSRMHMVWIKTVAGRLKSDYRYSAELCYNTFPIPEIDRKEKEVITKAVMNILQKREKFSHLSLSELYDPDKMSDELKEAHVELDTIIEKCYRQKSFSSDGERIEFLFSLYKKMIERES